MFKCKVLEMENCELLTPEYDEISLKTRKLATLGLLPAKAIKKKIIQPLLLLQLYFVIFYQQPTWVGCPFFVKLMNNLQVRVS